MVRLRAAWEVRAGVIPGVPEDEYSKRFTITSNDPDDAEFFIKVRDEAHQYAKDLTSPARFNWVGIEFIWL